MKGFTPHGFMKKGIESTISQASEGTKIDPLKSDTDTVTHKAGLLSDESAEQIESESGSRGKRDKRKDLSDEFFLSDLDIEQ